MFSNDFQKIVTLDVLWWEKWAYFITIDLDLSGIPTMTRRWPNRDPTLAQP